MAVPVGSGHRLGDLGQTAEGLAVPGEALLEDHDPLEPAIPFSHEEATGLQADAVPCLGRATLETSGRVASLRGSKDPSDRFVETAGGVRLESIGQHPHQ
jgi:hypothetical protein